MALAVAGAGCGTEADTDVTDASMKVEVVASEYSFAGLDDLSAGKTEFSLRNAGEEEHEVIVFPGAPPEGEEFPPGAGILITKPGTTAPAILSVDLAPGTWTFVCTLPDADGTEHVELGMVQVVEVA